MKMQTWKKFGIMGPGEKWLLCALDKYRTRCGPYYAAVAVCSQLRRLT